MRREMVLALALLAPALAAAQQPGGGTITGLVYDSLIGAPLAGAHVLVSGTARGAVTDQGGRFRIDSVAPGSHLVTFAHPDLDSIGLSATTARVMVPAGGTTDVVLATRSAATLRRAACGARALGPHGDSGVVFGDVRDATSGARLAGAGVTAWWTAIVRRADGMVSTTPAIVATRTDSLGSFYLCGVPNEVGVTLQARADSFASGDIDVQVGPRLLLRRELMVSREPLRVLSRGALRPSALLTESSAVRRGTAVLVGTVTEARGTPTAGATVSVEGWNAEGVTDERGRFILTGLPPGSRMVTARMVGYAAARTQVNLRGRDTTRVPLLLRPIAVLDTITVVARGPRERLLAEIEERRVAARGFVVLEEDIKTRGNTRSLFFGMNNVLTEGTGSVRYDLYFQLGHIVCAPTIYIDGVRGTLAELQAWRNDQLVALEVYPRATSAALGRFVSRDACGIVLAWTFMHR